MHHRDPDDQYIREFHRHLDAMTSFYRNEIIRHAKDRILADQEMCSEAKVPVRKRFSLARRVICRIPSLVRDFVMRREKRREFEQARQDPTVIVINPGGSIRSRRSSHNGCTDATERSFPYV